MHLFGRQWHGVCVAAPLCKLSACHVQEVDEIMLDGFLQAAYFTDLDAVVGTERASLQQRHSR